jgi:hypothetical protein
MTTSLLSGLIIALALFCGLLVPYLVEEIKRGKNEVGPRNPIGAADTRPGYRGNPEPGHPMARVRPEGATLSLRSFHVVFISLSIILAAGTGVWALLNRQILLGILALCAALLLIVYETYFLRKTAEAHLE